MSSFYFWHWRICVLMRLNKGAFDECSKLISVEFKNPEGWKRGSTAVLSDDLKNPETAATYLITKVWNAWTRG